jgi:hypothetical protein
MLLEENNSLLSKVAANTKRADTLQRILLDDLLLTDLLGDMLEGSHNES